jgi:hypothetical protein
MQYLINRLLDAIKARKQELLSQETLTAKEQAELQQVNDCLDILYRLQDELRPNPLQDVHKYMVSQFLVSPVMSFSFMLLIVGAYNITQLYYR